MNKIALILFLSLGLGVSGAQASDEHGHAEEAGHADEHGHKDEDSSQGFKLSAEAFKNFEIKTIAASTGSMKLAKSSIFFGLQERNLYRLRDGLFRRIDFKTLSKTASEYVVSSSDLKTGDQIAITGIGFLRIAELAASGGISDSHSH